MKQVERQPYLSWLNQLNDWIERLFNPALTKAEMDFDLLDAKRKLSFLNEFSILGTDTKKMVKEYESNPLFYGAVKLIRGFREHTIDKQVINEAIEKCRGKKDREFINVDDLKKELKIFNKNINK